MQRTISAQPNRSSTASPNQLTNVGSNKDSSDGDSDHTIRATDQSTRHVQQENNDSSKRRSLDDNSGRSNKRFKASHPRQQSASLEQHSNGQNPSGTTIYYTAREFHSMSLSPESPNISPLRNNHRDDSCDEIVAEVIEEFHVRTPFGDDDDDGLFKVTDGGSEKESVTTMPHVQLPADHSFSWSTSDRQAASDMRHQLSRECSLSPIPFRHEEPSMLSPKRQSVTRASTATNSNSFQASNDENNSPRRPSPPSPSPHFRTANQENDQDVEEIREKPHNIKPFSKVHDTPLSRRITLKAKDNQYQDVYRHGYQHVYQHASRFDTTRGGGNAYQYSPTEHLLLDQSKGWSAFRNL